MTEKKRQIPQNRILNQTNKRKKVVKHKTNPLWTFKNLSNSNKFYKVVVRLGSKEKVLFKYKHINQEKYTKPCI